MILDTGHWMLGKNVNVNIQQQESRIQHRGALSVSPQKNGAGQEGEASIDFRSALT